MTVPRPEGRVFDRQQEWRQLSKVWQSKRPELMIALGRRRVGKSHLLAPFCEAVGGIYYQATRRTSHEQLRILTGMLAERFDETSLRYAAFPDWESLLDYLADKSANEPVMLVVDEFPYLDFAEPALPSIIQKAWDHQLKDTQLKLVLCGSHITHMRRLEEADQPLYARRTARMEVRPFSLWDVAHFVPGYGPRELLLTYGVFGGVPGHLALLDPALDVKGNVIEQILDPGSRLFDESQHVLDTFLSQAEVHYSILEAIASGEQTWSGITSRLGKSSGSLSRPMNWLIDMEMVQRAVPITEKNPGRSKKALYRIGDPHLRFWHRFMAPLVQAGTLHFADPVKVFESRIEPDLDQMMGPVFEAVCREWVKRSELMEVLRVGEWWSKDEQVDVVAVSTDNGLLVGECKWGKVSGADLSELQARGQRIQQALGTKGPITHVLFSGGGMKRGLKKRLGEHVHHVGIEDLVSDPRG